MQSSHIHEDLTPHQALAAPLCANTLHTVMSFWNVTLVVWLGDAGSDQTLLEVFF